MNVSNALKQTADQLANEIRIHHDAFIMVDELGYQDRLKNEYPVLFELFLVQSLSDFVMQFLVGFQDETGEMTFSDIVLKAFEIIFEQPEDFWILKLKL